MSKAVLLFDVDGTLTEPRKPITLSMKSCLQEMRDQFELGVVSGSDLPKIKEQLGDDLITSYDYIFAENGLDTYLHGKHILSESIEDYLGKNIIDNFKNYCLNYISKLVIPTKTGNFVEMRKGLINVSPVGRDCSYEQRIEFEKYDSIHKIREKMIQNLQKQFATLNLEFSIGGQISFDVFPKGWDKTYCLRYLSNRTIHFFGDKTKKGGNDYEIYNDPRVMGHAVNSYHDTITILRELIKKPQLFKRAAANPLLTPLKSSPWESEAVYNPGAILINDKIYIIYRAAGENWLTKFGCAISKDGLSIEERFNYPIFICDSVGDLSSSENKSLPIYYYASGGSLGGCEDPRLVLMGNIIYMTFTFYDGFSAPRMALTSIRVEDFLKRKFSWKPPLFISPPGQIHKNWVLFPEKIKGKFALLHALSPGILIKYLDDLDFKNPEFIESFHANGHHEHRWDTFVRGAGPPPIKTAEGWLVFYHAMDKKDPNKYKLGAMILDLNEPTKILYRSKRPLLEPVTDYETHGFKSGVVYCCGAVVKQGKIFIYYGGADSVVCAAEADLREVLKAIREQT